MPVALDELQRAFDTTGQVVAQVRPDQLSQPTPCTEWTVRDLLDHIVGTMRMFTISARGGTTEWTPSGSPGAIGSADVASAYDTAASDAMAAWRERGLDGTVKMPVGESPAPAAMSTQFCDVLIHGFDLARALGQEMNADDDLIAAAWEHLDGRLPDEARGEGKGFAARVAVPDDAPTRDRLLAYMGRTP